MIEISLNGEIRCFPSPVTVSDLLETLKLTGKRVAVEKNGEIVPKGLHASSVVQDGDRLEVVVAVGGG